MEMLNPRYLAKIHASMQGASMWQDGNTEGFVSICFNDQFHLAFLQVRYLYQPTMSTIPQEKDGFFTKQNVWRAKAKASHSFLVVQVLSGKLWSACKATNANPLCLWWTQAQFGKNARANASHLLQPL